MRRPLVLLWLVMLSLVSALPVWAQNARAARQNVEASMLVTGHVEIGVDGRVSGFVFDQLDALQPPVVSLLYRNVPTMRFEPVTADGVPVRARAKMSLRLVAKRTGADEMHVRLASAHFGEESTVVDRTPPAVTMPAPPYPKGALQVGGRGIVYLLLKIGLGGVPQDVIAEQVNLTAIGAARDMAFVRENLSQAAISNAREHWRFAQMSEEAAAGHDYWVARVPIAFSVHGDPEAKLGEWAPYHPGERHSPTWAGPTQPGFSPDALVAGRVTPGVSRFRLLTPLDG